jgi:hypothetical protein
MIQLPRRSVTRFFIPLIDVMTLLFCIFLLMPIFKEGHPDNPDVKEREALKKELLLRTQERDALQHELDLIRNRPALPLTERVVVKTLDVDPASGRLFYYEPGTQAKRTEVTEKGEGNSVRAADLIARHQRELATRFKGRRDRPELLYVIIYPRGGAFPTLEQHTNIRQWFAAVPYVIDWPGAAAR